MRQLGIPSYNHLFSKEHSIRAIQDIYEFIVQWKKEVDAFIDGTPTDDMLWADSGQNYNDVKVAANMIPVNWTMRVSKDITCADGDNIILVIDSSFFHYFHRADMNGVEIHFSESTVTSGGKTYKVLTSEDTYEAGTYNIDING